jgi:ribonuclease P protein component
MSLYIRKSEPADAPTRVGLAVPGGAGGAVVRNRIKRRLRAAAARALPRRGWDVLISAHADLDSISFHEIVGGLQEAVTSSARRTP